MLIANHSTLRDFKREAIVLKFSVLFSRRLKEKGLAINIPIPISGSVASERKPLVALSASFFCSVSIKRRSQDEAGRKYLDCVSGWVTLCCFWTCGARNETIDGWFYNSYLGLQEIPPIPDFVVGLYLNNNNIGNITVGKLNHLKDCTFLSLSWNLITSIEARSFEGMRSLKDVSFFRNLLTELVPDTFVGLSMLDNMVLSNNSIHTVPREAFNGLENLKKLYLYQNNLQILKTSMFAELTSLDELTLTFNKITVMESGCFMGLGNLEKLWLDNNNVLKELRKHMFVGLTKLTRLAIHTNNINDIGECGRARASST